MIGHLYRQIFTNDTVSEIKFIVCTKMKETFVRLSISFPWQSYLAAKSQCGIFKDSRYFMPDAICLTKRN